jgi:hypothetical protein
MQSQDQVVSSHPSQTETAVQAGKRAMSEEIVLRKKMLAVNVPVTCQDFLDIMDEFDILDLIQILRHAVRRVTPEHLERIRTFMGDSFKPTHESLLQAIQQFQAAEAAFQQSETVDLGSKVLPHDWLFPDPNFEERSDG